MTVSDVTSRIAQIQSQLAILTPATSSAAAFSTSLSAVNLSDQTGLTGAVDPTPLPGDSSSGGVGALGTQVVDEARKYLGIPYLWGGTDPKRGLDCSGLVQLVYSKFGIDLPRVSYQQAEAGRPVASLAAARPGDILAFGSPVHHVAIYIGNGQMIEAPRTGIDVRVSSVYETPTAIRRVLPEVVDASRTQVPGAPYENLFNAASEKYGVDAALLSAVAKQESGYNPAAVSPAGAQGLMQLMPATAQGLGVENSFDPAQAVDGAARLLRDLLDRFGRTDLALAAYNAGPGAVLRYGGIPPYPETQNYVSSVMSILGEN